MCVRGLSQWPGASLIGAYAGNQQDGHRRQGCDAHAGAKNRLPA
jgi:hypothetical protein